MANTCKCGKEYETTQSLYAHQRWCLIHRNGIARKPSWQKGKPSKLKGTKRGVDIARLNSQLTNPSTIQSTSLRTKLLNAGIKQNKCEICGIDKWNNAEITLELHHVDGDKRNNALDNLQIICPNCHSQTDNFRFKGKHHGDVDQRQSQRT